MMQFAFVRFCANPTNAKRNKTCRNISCRIYQLLQNVGEARRWRRLQVFGLSTTMLPYQCKTTLEPMSC